MPRERLTRVRNTVKNKISVVNFSLFLKERVLGARSELKRERAFTDDTPTASGLWRRLRRRAHWRRQLVVPRWRRAQFRFAFGFHKSRAADEYCDSEIG